MSRRGVPFLSDWLIMARLLSFHMEDNWLASRPLGVVAFGSASHISLYLSSNNMLFKPRTTLEPIKSLTLEAFALLPLWTSLTKASISSSEELNRSSKLSMKVIISSLTLVGLTCCAFSKKSAGGSFICIWREYREMLRYVYCTNPYGILTRWLPHSLL